MPRPRRTDEGRGSAARRGYDRHHQRWRLQVLARDPVCVECLRRGRVTAANVADHVVPIAVDPGRRLDVDNGRGLCERCHALITDNFKRTGCNEMPDE